jgi:hypothetical protein
MPTLGRTTKQPAVGRRSYAGKGTVAEVTKALGAILALGVILRVAVYVRAYSLYIDEAALASSILNRSWTQLLTPPLDYGQLAPPGFLLIQRTLTRVLGTGELALRSFPFATGLLTLPLFVALARRILDRRAVLLAAMLAAVSYGLVFYAAHLKQYSTDTLASTALVFWALALERRGWPARGSLALGLTGAATVWVSQPAIFVLAGITLSAGWLRRHRMERPQLRRVILMGCLWVPSAVLAARMALRYVYPKAYIEDFWYTGYFPWPITSLPDLTWPVRALLRPLTDPLGLVPGWFRTSSPASIALMELTFLAGPPIVFALVAGLVRAWKSRDRRWLYVVSPVGVTFAAAVLHLYPFGSSVQSGGRTVLFLTPAYLLAIAHGALPLWNRFPRWRRPAVLFVGLSPLAVLAAWMPVRHREELAPVLQAVAQQWRPGDQLWIYYGALPAFHYYGPRTKTDGLPRVEGVCAPLDPPAYTRDLDRLRPSTGLWVVFSHVNRPHGWGEDAYILAHLDGIGTRTARVEAKGASAHRFILSAPEVANRYGPVPYPLLNPLPQRIHRYDCAGGFGPWHPVPSR